MTEQSMIERAALALIAEIRREGEDTNYVWTHDFEPTTPITSALAVDGEIDATALVRAVLLAIRKPSLTALSAGAEAFETVPDDADDIFHAEVMWPAMIDAALERDT